MSRTRYREAREFYPRQMPKSGRLSEVVAFVGRFRSNGEVVVSTDTIPLANRRQAIERAARTTLSRLLPRGAKYRLLHHQSRSLRLAGSGLLLLGGASEVADRRNRLVSIH